MTITDEEAKRNEAAMLAAARRKENLELGWPDDHIDAADAETLVDARAEWIARQARTSRGSGTRADTASVGDAGEEALKGRDLWLARLCSASAAVPTTTAGDSTIADSADAVGDDEPIGRDAWMKRQKWVPQGGAR